MFILRKTHIHWICLNTIFLGLFFAAKKMIVKRRRQLWWRFSFWQSVWTMVCFNKALFILGTSQKGTSFWALYDGIRIVNWYISRTAGSNLNSKKATHQKHDILFNLKRVKILRRLIENFFQQSPELKCNISKSITLDCNNDDHEYAKLEDSDFTVPRCTSHCFARLIFRNNIYVGRQNICKYVEQMVSTYIPISENQFDWFKGVDMEATVRNHIRQMLQNIKSQYISKNCSTNCSKKNNLGYRIQTSVPKSFVDHSDNPSLQQRSYKNKKS